MQMCKVYKQCLQIFLTIKSPDELVITKQACRDDSIVSLFFLNSSSTVLWKSRKTYRESASRFSRGTVLNMLKQSEINRKKKKDATTFSRQACFVNRFTLQGFNERIFM